MKKTIIILSIFICSMSPLYVGATEKSPNDHRALAGLTTGKAVFDVNITSAESMILYLNVVQQTITTLKAQGVAPDIVITFRGAAVSIVSKDSEFNSDLDEKTLTERMAALKKENVHLEACQVAANLYAVDSKDLLPGIVMVGNTFASLIGYQSKGYALIPLM